MKWYLAMSRSSNFRALIIITAVTLIVVGFVYYFYRPEAEEQEAKGIIESVVRAEFLPSQYALNNGSRYDFFGFGRDHADHYYIEWRVGTIYLAAIFGHEKQWPNEVMGYKIIAWERDPLESRDELARKLFNSIPDSGWKQAGPVDNMYGNTSISCVLWEADEDKLYVEVVEYKYKEPTHVDYMSDDESVQYYALILYYDITPLMTNPIYRDMRSFQDAELWLYGGAELPD